MDKSDLLFYDAYEEFYTMASQSQSFKNFCLDAFGEDFSQDGFSDIEQINQIVNYIPNKEGVHILDIGCGNGKMLGYLQEKTKAYIHGFDYSEEAINTANDLYSKDSEFKAGIIGEIDYIRRYRNYVVHGAEAFVHEERYRQLQKINEYLKTEMENNSDSQE